MSKIHQKSGSINGVNLMMKAQAVIMGKAVDIRYTIHTPAYVEWRLAAKDSEELADEMILLECLLRTHYNDFIQGVCREDAFYKDWAASAAADDWLDSVKYAAHIRPDLFKAETAEEKDDDNDDIPF